MPYDPQSQFLALVVDGLLRTFVLAADGRQITLGYSRPGAARLLEQAWLRRSSLPLRLRLWDPDNVFRLNHNIPPL